MADVAKSRVARCGADSGDFGADDSLLMALQISRVRAYSLVENIGDGYAAHNAA
jgi:hypothetical protein